MDAFDAMPSAAMDTFAHLFLLPGGYGMSDVVPGASAPLAAYLDTNSVAEMDAAETWLGTLDVNGCEGACWGGAARAQEPGFLRALQN